MLEITGLDVRKWHEAEIGERIRDVRFLRQCRDQTYHDGGGNSLTASSRLLTSCAMKPKSRVSKVSVGRW